MATSITNALDRRRFLKGAAVSAAAGAAALGPALIEDGFSWVVFTGADTVRNVFRRLHLKPIALCIANKSLLGDAQKEWGTYYEHNPVVMAGRLADGIGALEAAALVR